MKTWVAFSMGVLLTVGCSSDRDVAGTLDSQIGDGADGSSVPATDLLEAYCPMEAECIPWCACAEDTCACDSEQRMTECAQDVLSWEIRDQSTECEFRIATWTNCLAARPCADVEAFFRAHPDEVTELTPCGAEFDALNAVCEDFEPLTEYSFDEASGEGATPGLEGTGGTGNSSVPATDLLEAYCPMEAECIPWCTCAEDTCACDSKQRMTECAQDVLSWEIRNQSTECEFRIATWTNCLAARPCADVEAFFRAFPDEVTKSTPCGAEFDAVNAVCEDFEPLTEYSFDDQTPGIGATPDSGSGGSGN